MNDEKTKVAETCLRGAEDNSLTFPEIVGVPMNAGFESNAVDFRRATATYYLPDGASVVLSTHRPETSVALAFDARTIQAAIKEAQQLVPGYTYMGFCKKVTAAGCAGYIVSFPGRRVVYFGRTAETHVEQFPQ